MKSKSKYSIFFLFVIIVIIAIVCLSGCDEKDTDGDGFPDSKDKCPKEFSKTNNGCKVKAEKEIGKIHFYIETSGSMAGYFDKTTEAKSVITNFITKIDNSIGQKPFNIYYVDGIPARKYTKSTSEFIDEIATTKFAIGKSSQLDKIIEHISSKNQSDQVTLLVSDFILSFPDKDIKSNPNINKENANGSLKAKIFERFSQLKKKGFAVSIYGFKSMFHGNYFDYQNSKTEINESRPYYVWVIADKEILKSFNKKVHEFEDFKPEKELSFGLYESDPITDKIIFPTIERGITKWTAMSSNEGIEEIEGDNFQFTVGLNLSNLPAYAQDINYLNSNIKYSSNECTVNLKFIAKDKIDPSKIRSKNQKLSFNECTHFLTLDVKKMLIENGKIEIELPFLYENWYESWSCDSDITKEQRKDKTFAFKHLVEGVKEVYSTKDQKFIKFSLTLKK